MTEPRSSATLHPLTARFPDYVRNVPDFESRPALREIYRSIRVLRFLTRLDPRDVVQTIAPQPGAELVSVVLPMYNAREWIDLCLTSLLVQAHARLEVFCVDDASTDDTFERVVARFGRDRRLCIVRLAGNVGPYQIKNWIVARAARGRLVALQDADDVSHPMRIEEQMRWLDRERVGVCGVCVHQFFPPSIHPPVGGPAQIELEGTRHNIAFYEALGPLREPVDLRQALRQRPRPHARRRHAGIAFYGSQLLERDLFLDFGGFDGHTRVGADTELSRRLIRLHRIENVPKVLYSRRFHAQSLTEDPETGRTSPLRQRYQDRRDRRLEAIRLAILAEDAPQVRELCTSDLFFGDVRIAEVHTGFDANLSV